MAHYGTCIILHPSRRARSRLEILKEEEDGKLQCPGIARHYLLIAMLTECVTAEGSTPLPYNVFISNSTIWTDEILLSRRTVV